MEQEYRGHKIRFNERKEVWECRVKVPQGDDYTDISDASLATVKKFVDKILKKSFKRVRVFAEKPHSWSYQKDTRPKFITAEITSISPDGDIFIVYQGEKTARKVRCQIWEDTPANAKLVAKINLLDKKVEQAKEEMEEHEDAMTTLDTKKMRDEFLSV
jgi:hypothetical protein